jgi:hypothetical protein
MSLKTKHFISRCLKTKRFVFVSQLAENSKLKLSVESRIREQRRNMKKRIVKEKNNRFDVSRAVFLHTCNRFQKLLSNLVNQINWKWVVASFPQKII